MYCVCNHNSTSAGLHSWASSESLDLDKANSFLALWHFQGACLSSKRRGWSIRLLIKTFHLSCRAHRNEHNVGSDLVHPCLWENTLASGIPPHQSNDVANRSQRMALHGRTSIGASPKQALSNFFGRPFYYHAFSRDM